MIKRKLFIMILALAVMLLGCGLIYGQVSTAVTNSFETGAVDIDLTEYQKVGDQEVAWVDNPTIAPGDVISKIPRVDNKGNDCYIRAKFTFRETEELNDGHLLGRSDKWIKADDGYWYYTEVIPNGAHVDLFQALKIPEDFGKGEGQFYLDIAVDAIQSANLTPEFHTASPWGNVEILKAEMDGEYDVSKLKPSDKPGFQVIYQGDVGKLIATGEDFFEGMPYLMPGDTYRDTLHLVNDGDQEIRLHFRSETQDLTELLDKIQLKIITNINGIEEIFYEGSLRAAELNQDGVLGTIPANSQGDFRFEIIVPAQLNNAYSLFASQVTWVFSTEVIPPLPDTGDRGANMYLTLLGVSLLGVGVLLLAGLREKENKKKEGEQDA